MLSSESQEAVPARFESQSTVPLVGHISLRCTHTLTDFYLIEIGWDWCMIYQQKKKKKRKTSKISVTLKKIKQVKAINFHVL